MKLKKYYFWLLIAALYFLTRLVNLYIIPIFTDEAIYSYWAQVALHDPQNRFISLEDGKQPFFIWLSAIFQSFISDPLIAGRLVSVFAGFGSVAGIYLLAKELFDKKAAQIASLLYILLPFTTLYDRMGLFDSLLTSFGIYSFYLAVKVAKKPRLDLAIAGGIVIGLALITKSSAYFYLLLLPISLMFLNFKRPNLIKWSVFTAVTGVISMLIYNSLRYSPLFFRIGQKNLEFIRNTQEVLAKPFLNFSGNLDSQITWLVDYMGFPLAALALITALWGVYKLNRQIIILCAYILMPVFAMLFFNKVLYPRFSLIFFPYIIILVAFALSALVARYKKTAIFAAALFVVYPIYSSAMLIFDPPSSKITEADKHQYLNEWPAGYGVREVVEIIKVQAKAGKVYVGTEGTFGLLPYALQIYFWDQQNIQIVGFWPVREIPQQVLSAANDKKTYFVFNENQNLSDDPGNPRLKLIGKYQKGTGNSYMRLYEVKAL